MLFVYSFSVKMISTMKKVILLMGLALCLGSLQAQKKDYFKSANFDESKVPVYTLPDPLVCQDGERVTTSEQWEQKRRPELMEMLTTYMYGKVPEAALQKPITFTVDRVNKKALKGRATRKEITIHLTGGERGQVIHLQLYLPNKVKGTVPVFLGIAFTPNYTIYNDPDLVVPEAPVGTSKKPVRGSSASSWQLDKILEHGYGLATFCYTEVTPDDKLNDYHQGVQTYYYRKGQTYPDPDQWGAVSAWAWALSRAMDYLEQDPQVDAQHVAVLGHSRLGKTALWAGATDKRFAIVFPVNSGCCGAALSRRCFGETVEAVNYNFPHWFCGNYKQFDSREKYMPFDQHEVVAMVAPRPIYIASAEDDNWADQKGEFLGGKGAEPVYALYGEAGIGINSLPPVDVPCANGFIAYHKRKGPHAVLPYDWDQFLKFADRFFILK